MSKTPTSTLARAQKGGGTKLHNTLVYLRQHWQLYAFFIMPAFLLTVIFRYIPMGGIAIAFTDYNPLKGFLGSEWVAFQHFERFLSSPDFLEYLANTLKLSVFGLLYALISYFAGWAVSGWTAIVCSIWLLGGLQMLCLGVVGGSVGKFYSEEKAWPSYRVEEFLQLKPMK